MKKLAALFLLWSISHKGFTQEPQQAIIDSLKKELSMSKMDTSNVLSMVELVNQYKYSNPDSALFYAQGALILSRNIKFHEGEFRSLLMMGFALSLASNHSRALELELKALRISEKYNFTIGRGEVLNRLGVIYRETKDFPRALFYHKKSKQLFDSLHNYYKAVTSEVQLGRAYYLMNQTDSALYYCLMADNNIKRYGSESMSCTNFITLARLQLKKGNVQLALNYFRQSLLAGYPSGQYIFTFKSNLEIAEIYQQAGQMDSCIYYAQKALADAQKSNIGNSIAAVSLFLSALYEKSNLSLALEYQKMALEAIQKMNSFGNLNTMQNLAAFDEEERQYELDITQAAYQNRLKQYAMLAGLGVFLLIAFFLYRNNTQKQKANALLHHQKEEIHTQKLIAEKTLFELRSTQSQLIQSEKMASLGELTAGIAHEIQNPLNFVNNFSEVNTELIDEMKGDLAIGNMQQAMEIANDIRENEIKINQHGKRADGIVKGMLQHSQKSVGIKELTNINALAEEYLRLAYHAYQSKHKGFQCELKSDLDPNLRLVNVIPQDIGRVLLNLFNNAFWATNEKLRQDLNKREEDYRIQGYTNQALGSLPTGQAGPKSVSDLGVRGKTENLENNNPVHPPIPKGENISAYQPIVTLATKNCNDHIEIRISDNGPGIPQNIIDKIFQPFFTTKPTGQGTGLGLSLAYDIVKAHGGTILVNTNIESGTEFIIQLPINS